MKHSKNDTKYTKSKMSSLFSWYNLHDSRNFLSRPKLHFSYQGQCQNISSNESRQAADKSNKKYVKEGIKNVRILLERLICGMIDIKFLYLSWWHERWGCALFILLDDDSQIIDMKKT